MTAPLPIFVRVAQAPEVFGVSTSTIYRLAQRGEIAGDAAHGRAALDTLQANNDVALLFTDVVMPEGLNGRQLADEAVRRRPGLKVLFTTGYTRNAIVHNGQLDPGVNLITKPFTYAELATKVRTLLDR